MRSWERKADQSQTVSWLEQVAVTAKPQAWWQHAGHAVKQECRTISRWQAALRSLDIRRENRLRYQACICPLMGSRAMQICLLSVLRPRCHSFALQTLLCCQVSHKQTGCLDQCL